jgi:hypothetical protein
VERVFDGNRHRGSGHVSGEPLKGQQVREDHRQHGGQHPVREDLPHRLHAGCMPQTGQNVTACLCWGYAAVRRCRDAGYRDLHNVLDNPAR